MNVEAAIASFEQQREVLLKDLFTFLRFQTVSAQSQRAGDIQACAGWVRDQLASAGLAAGILPTGCHPVVFADSGPAPGPTLLFYGHYDVQPVGDASLWHSPPFDPTIRDGAIFARGSADDKGQLMTHLAAMRSWRAAGLPWPGRIKFLIEGEEEIGSPNLPAFVTANRERLTCDYVVLSDTSRYNVDTPALAYSSRGLVYKQITIEGPTRDLHSGIFGGTVANPANILAAILAGLQDEQGRVTIPGFYDDVLPLTPQERETLNRHGMSDEQLLERTGSPAPYGEDGFTTTERCGARPTLDVNGLLSGYTGEGSSTIIPARAMAKVSMRLVAHQDPEKISQAFDEAVRKACSRAVNLRIDTFGKAAAYVAPTDSPAMRAAAKALTAGYGRPPVFIREGGTLPILPMFKQALGADSIMLGFAAPDCNLHSPNEFFHISDFEIGTRCIIRFMGEMASSG